MTESLDGYSPAERGEETIEQKRARFKKIIDLINKDLRLLTKTSDILEGKRVPNLFLSGKEPDKTIFLAETTTRTNREQTKQGVKSVGERISVTLRPVPIEDKALLIEFLSLPSDEQVALGVQALRTEINATTTENRFRDVLSTSGELMRYLMDERG